MQESGENYLETILILQERLKIVRSIDVVREMKVSKPSVSRAISVLKSKGYVEVGANGELLFTEKGQEKANQIYERHRILSQFLMITLGIEESVAVVDACRMEHIVSQEVFDSIKKYLSA